ncbi:MAG: photosystem II protein Y [Cyanobacteria bacterium P01_H01_bin.121]
MDWRIVIVLLPIALAGGWALFNVGQAALQQVQKVLDKNRA